MNRIVKIDKRSIGDGYACFIIAEAGSNHDGDFKQALALIDVACEADADAIKFQTFKAEKLYTKKAGYADYLKNKKSIYQIIKEMEMPEDWIPRLAKYCQKKGIIFLSTPFDEEAVDLLDDHVPAFKIASYEMNHIPLVKYIAGKRKPIIMSTGSADLSEVRRSVEVIKKQGNKNLILMQCTACYPTPVDSLNLKSIITMKNKFHVPIGISDHSRELDIGPLAAVALGANCVEKHFTISNAFAGPDHKFAVEPEELRLMIKKIREVEKALGTGEKEVLRAEKELRQFARRSVFAIEEIRAGDIFSKRNTAVLRAGKIRYEVNPEEYEYILGRCAKRRIEKYASLRRGDY